MVNIFENIKDNMILLLMSIFVLMIGFFELAENVNLPEEMNSLFRFIGIMGMLGTLFISTPKIN